MSKHHPFGQLLTEFRARKPGLSQTRLAELAGYAPAILVRMSQGKKDLTGPSGRERIVRLVGTLSDEGVRLTLDDVNALLASANLPPLYDGLPTEAALIRRLHGNVASAIPRRSNLLPALTSFIGREAEIADLTERLTKARLVTLTGAGGVGKTRLALEVAARVVRVVGATDSVAPTPHIFHDGVWLAELASLSDPQLVSQTVAQVLGISAGRDGSALGVLQRHLQSKHVLLVLDNCEHVIDACVELVEEMLPRCPNVCILATSREALRVPGETVWQVPSLTIPNITHLAPERLLDYEAVRLFVERASASQRTFELKQGNASSVAQICQRLDGIPLALELAAALTQGMTVQEIAAHLDKHLSLLTDGYRRAAPRQHTMRGALDWSYYLLSPAQQRLLARLSVFVGGWTADAAEAVSDDDPSDVLPSLFQLVRKSLVLAEPREVGTRYRLLEPIRQYAAEKLEEIGEEKSARDRHLACFVAFAEQADAGMMGFECGAWVKRVLMDYDNLRAASTWGREGVHDCESELRLAGSLWRFWVVHAQLREGQTWIEAVLERCSSITSTVRARALYGLAWQYRYLRYYRRMARFAEESLALCRESNDRHGSAICLLLLAVRAQIEFDYAREAALRAESLSICREMDDVFSASNALFEGAWTAIDRRGYVQAAALLDELAELTHKMSDLNGVWTSLWWRAFVALRCGENVKAVAYLEQSLAAARESGVSEFVARSIELWALVDRPQAAALGVAERNLRREAGDSLGLADMLLAIGRITLDLGDLEDAEALLIECVSQWDAIGMAESEWGGAAWACLELGHIARLQGDFGHATARYEESLRRHQEAGAMDGVGAACLNLGHVALAQGEISNGMRWFKRSLSQYREVGMRPGIALALAGMCDVARLQDCAPQAARLAGAAASLLRDEELVTMRPPERANFECIIVAARAQLTDDACAAAWAEGQAMTIKQAIALGLAH